MLTGYSRETGRHIESDRNRCSDISKKVCAILECNVIKRERTGKPAVLKINQFSKLRVNQCKFTLVVVSAAFETKATINRAISHKKPTIEISSMEVNVFETAVFEFDGGKQVSALSFEFSEVAVREVNQAIKSIRRHGNRAVELRLLDRLMFPHLI